MCIFKAISFYIWLLLFVQWHRYTLGSVDAGTVCVNVICILSKKKKKVVSLCDLIEGAKKYSLEYFIIHQRCFFFLLLRLHLIYSQILCRCPIWAGPAIYIDFFIFFQAWEPAPSTSFFCCDRWKTPLPVQTPFWLHHWLPTFLHPPSHPRHVWEQKVVFGKLFKRIFLLSTFGGCPLYHVMSLIASQSGLCVGLNSLLLCLIFSYGQ